MRLIGLCGRAGSGKSTAAARLAARHGYARHPFAGPLKMMLATLLRAEGATDDEIGNAIDGGGKSKPNHFLAGATPREAMQLLGTEWGRALHPDFWLNAWGLSWPANGHVVVDDVRFSNEAGQVRAMGGRVIRIERPGDGLAGAAGSHVSERQVIEPDAVIVNDSDVEALNEAIDRLA